MAKQKGGSTKKKARPPARCLLPQERRRPQRRRGLSAHAESVRAGRGDSLYSVDRIVGHALEQGSRAPASTSCEVRWEGNDAKHDTYKPMDNLVGCTEQIRVYEKSR